MSSNNPQSDTIPTHRTPFNNTQNSDTHNNLVKTYQIKLVLLGQTSVGKSCLVIKFAKGEFPERQETTIGAAFSTQSVTLDDSIVKFEIWDTAGQERYRTLAPMYYRGAAAAIIVYDITSKDSFDKSKSWISELYAIQNKDIVLALAGNKDDLGSERQVDTELAREYANENGLIFMETSAKTGHNVIELFEEIAMQIPKKKDEPPTDPGIKVGEQSESSLSSCGCGWL